MTWMDIIFHGGEGNYGMKVNSSMGQYAYKNGVTSKLNSKFIQYMMNCELQDAIYNLKKYYLFCL